MKNVRTAIERNKERDFKGGLGKEVGLENWPLDFMPESSPPSYFSDFIRFSFLHVPLTISRCGAVAKRKINAVRNEIPIIYK